jgi:hypothetical protein
MKLDELITKFKAFKEELNKNNEEKPSMGHSSFHMDHIKEVSGMKDHGEAKKFAHGVVDSSTANPKNKAKLKAMINGSRNVGHLAQGMSNHMLAHPSEGLKVLKAESEAMCMSENGQWSMKKWNAEKKDWE